MKILLSVDAHGEIPMITEKIDLIFNLKHLEKMLSLLAFLLLK